METKKGITFGLFADLHYKKGMYLSMVEDMEKILYRANENNADFVIHAGDYSNDYNGSREIVDVYLKNKYNLPVYGIYGNHELESKGNRLETVTPLLTNRASEVVWGTDDGKIGDGSIGYYYFDVDDFRIICTDTNYSYNEELSCWQHNLEASWGAPQGNIKVNSLGPEQLKWLEKVLFDAADKGKHCIVASHAAFYCEWSGDSPDSAAVRDMFKKANDKKRGTVIMSLNGHYHTNRIAESDNIVYFDVNTVRNGCWRPGNEEHYSPEHTFLQIDYDENGVAVGSKTAPLSALWQSKNTWYFDKPLSAIVTISKDGQITVSGSKAEWIYGVIPDVNTPIKAPEITDAEFKLDIN